MIENLEKHMNTKFTTNEKLIDNIFRSPFFEDLEEINEGVFEVRQRKKQVTITRPYQCGIAVYQLAKLRMLEFYYDFLESSATEEILNSFRWTPTVSTWHFLPMILMRLSNLR